MHVITNDARVDARVNARVYTITPRVDLGSILTAPTLSLQDLQL